MKTPLALSEYKTVAVGTPVVSLFGPSDPERVGPWGEGQVILRVPPHRPGERRVHGAVVEDLDVDTVAREVLARLRPDD